MRAATIGVLLLTCLPGVWAQTLGDEEQPGADDVEAMLSKAAIAPLDEYVALRNEVLSSPLDRLRGLAPREGRGWREQVIARAWIEWRRAPEECEKLWNNEIPPGANRRFAARNPFPALAAASHRMFLEARERGLFIGREMMLKGEVLHGALPGLLKDDGSELSRKVLIEAALHVDHHSVANNLLVLEPSVAPRILARLNDASPRCLPNLIRLLGELEHRPAIPRLGQLLQELERKGGAYTDVDERVGEALLFALRRLTGVDLEGLVGVPEPIAARIDSAKAWWQQNAERYREVAEGGGGRDDGI